MTDLNWCKNAETAYIGNYNILNLRLSEILNSLFLCLIRLKNNNNSLSIYLLLWIFQKKIKSQYLPRRSIDIHNLIIFPSRKLNFLNINYSHAWRYMIYGTMNLIMDTLWIYFMNALPIYIYILKRVNVALIDTYKYMDHHC